MIDPCMLWEGGLGVGSGDFRGGCQMAACTDVVHPQYLQSVGVCLTHVQCTPTQAQGIPT